MQIYSIPNYNTNSRINFKAIRPKQGGQDLRNVELGLETQISTLTKRVQEKTAEYLKSYSPLTKIEIERLNAQIDGIRAELTKLRRGNPFSLGWWQKGLSSVG